MSRSKRILCAMLVCMMLTCSTSFSEEETVESTPVPTAEPTAEPTSEPTAESTSEPTAEPTAEPAVEPTAEPTGQGGFPGGGFPGGGRPAGGSGGSPSGFSGSSNPAGSTPAGVLPVQDQGFRVTPGEALTSSHASGSKDMQMYGTVQLSTAEEPMTILTLGETQLDIVLDGQASSFIAACEEDTLILTPQSEGEVWSVNALALKILNRSGIAHIRLIIGEEAVELSTQWNLQGAEYARLSAAGYVSKDYTLSITRTQTLVKVAEEVFSINENNELVGG